MVIIIDGYNLLRRVFPRVKGHLEKQRKQLVKLLGYYAAKKEKEVQEIIIVYDAGPFLHATREVHQGVVVMFAGQRSSADEWIFEYVQRNEKKEKLLVSTDHELVKQCEEFKTRSIDVFEFYALVKDCILSDTDGQEGSPSFVLSDDIKKYEDQDDDQWNQEVDRKALDLLMEQASMNVPDKQDGKDLKHEKKKGASRKMSKKEREIHSIFKKLK